MAIRDDKRNASTEDLERIRSTPLRPVIWMTTVLVWATVVALILRAPTWASVILSAITTTSFLLFVVGYIYLFVNDREALRAERWRTRPRGTSREVTGRQPRQLGDSGQEYLAPEPQTSGSSTGVPPVGHAQDPRTT